MDYVDAFVISFWRVFCTYPRRTADGRRRRVFRSLLGKLVERCSLFSIRSDDLGSERGGVYIIAFES